MSLRSTLFGDSPISEWPSGQPPYEDPWASFHRVRTLIDRGAKIEAGAVLLELASRPDLGSLHSLQAWTFLRQLGFGPDEEDAKTVLGVVIEIGDPAGLDVLAAYSDYAVHLIRPTGKELSFPKHDPRWSADVDRLVAVAQIVASRLAPSEARRPPPTTGIARLTVLTPGGLHVEEGTYGALQRDPLGGPLFGAADLLGRKLEAYARQKG